MAHYCRLTAQDQCAPSLISLSHSNFGNFVAETLTVFVKPYFLEEVRGRTLAALQRTRLLVYFHCERGTISPFSAL
jgi:hypothetical protein